MHEIVEKIFMCTTEYLEDSCLRMDEDSCLRMDEDHVGKQQDLYLWCSVGGPRIGVS
jgi:hypothetical protein